MKKHTIISAIAVAGLLVLTGCPRESAPTPTAAPGPAERAGAAVDRTAETAREKTGAALEKAGEAVEKAGSDLQE